MVDVTGADAIGVAVPAVEQADRDAAMQPGGAVAQVVLDVPLAHLDRPFDYAVPEALAAAAVPGARVVVRFAGREARGFVAARRPVSGHPGPLTAIARVVSPVAVLAPDVLALCRAVADRYAGTLADVLRLAVPPRHARVEAAVVGATPPEPGAPPVPSAGALAGWGAYAGGLAFVRRVAAGGAPRAVWTALPGGGDDAPEALAAAAVAACVASGRGAVVVVPDGRDVTRFAAALTAAGVPHARLTAEDGPAARYRAFLTALLGRVPVVVGTRSAAFAPVRDLGLVVCWDDGDDLLAEPRAPYPHALQVLLTRAEQARAAALVGSHARSTAAHLLVADGWARPVEAPRAVVRARTPQVVAPGEADLAREGPAARARIPHLAWEAARAALESGPVLVQAPRAGYVPVTACAACREPARCAACRGPLRLAGPDAAPSCAWCGRPAVDWACGACGGTRLRATRVGSARTAEELGRAFPGVPVVVSGAGAATGVLDSVPGDARIVVATPGAEPRVVGGYAAALILDADVTAGRPELWAGEEALRRWLGAAALVRPGPSGGRVLLLGAAPTPPTQALVRWHPAWLAERELSERVELRLPPTVRMASVQGEAAAVTAFLDHLRLPAGSEILGPVPVPPREGEPDGAAPVRAIVRVERRDGPALSRALVQVAALRSARKEPGSVRVQVDPTALW